MYKCFYMILCLVVNFGPFHGVPQTSSYAPVLHFSPMLCTYQNCGLNRVIENSHNSPQTFYKLCRRSSLQLDGQHTPLVRPRHSNQESQYPRHVEGTSHREEGQGCCHSEHWGQVPNHRPGWTRWSQACWYSQRSLYRWCRWKGGCCRWFHLH